MTNYHVKRYSGEPHLTKNEVSNPAIEKIVISAFTPTHKQSYIYERGGRYVAWSKGKIKPASEKRDNLYNAALFYVGIEGALFENAKDVNLEIWTDDELTKQINKLLDDFWKHESIVKIDIMLIGGLKEQFKPLETKVYTKKAPAKLESKKMCHNKSSLKKSPVKLTKMTGDIRKMGKQFSKNFNKLI